MSIRDRLGPVVDEETRKKFRVHWSPSIDALKMPTTVRWNPETSYYEPQDEQAIVPHGEVIDYFKMEAPNGTFVHLFARQFDTLMFQLKDSIFINCVLEPGKGNKQAFWFEEI